MQALILNDLRLLGQDCCLSRQPLFIKEKRPQLWTGAVNAKRHVQDRRSSLSQNSRSDLLFRSSKKSPSRATGAKSSDNARPDIIGRLFSVARERSSDARATDRILYICAVAASVRGSEFPSEADRGPNSLKGVTPTDSSPPSIIRRGRQPLARAPLCRALNFWSKLR